MPHQERGGSCERLRLPLNDRRKVEPIARPRPVAATTDDVDLAFLELQSDQRAWHLLAAWSLEDLDGGSGQLVHACARGHTLAEALRSCALIRDDPGGERVRPPGYASRHK